MRVQVFQHVAHEDLGALEPVFVGRGAEIQYTRFFAGDTPPLLSEFDLLVVLGGPMNVYEFDRHPWLEPETIAIRAALDAGKPVLGLCLGSQLMSVALGGTVTSNAHREIGWWPVEKESGLAPHAIAECFPNRFTTFHWHGDTFSVPPGAVPLFRSKGCAHQGFTWGDRAVALQFHPEITAATIDVWIAESLRAGGGDLEPGPYVQTAEEMHRDAIHIPENNRWMTALCDILCEPPQKKSPEVEGPILFFDGYCGICNGFVDFVLDRDPEAVFRFAPLQGETANRFIPSDAVPAPKDGEPAVPPRSLVLHMNGNVYRKSEAVLRAVPRLGGVWRLAAVLRLVPVFIRDFVYDIVARNRYRWFGTRTNCRLPGPGEKDRILL